MFSLDIVIESFLTTVFKNNHNKKHIERKYFNFFCACALDFMDLTVLFEVNLETVLFNQNFEICFL